MEFSEAPRISRHMAQLQVDPPWYLEWIFFRRTDNPTLPGYLAPQRDSPPLRKLAETTKQKQSQLEISTPILMIFCYVEDRNELYNIMEITIIIQQRRIN
jgi:hypothetical protein